MPHQESAAVVSSAVAIPHPRECILESLQHWAHVAADRRCCIFLDDRGVERSSLTFAELDKLARRMAVHLLASVEPGDRVVLCCPTSPEFVVALLGCFYAGIVAVPVSLPRSARGTQVTVAILRDCGGRLVLTARGLEDTIRSALSRTDELSDVEVRSIDLTTLTGEAPEFELPRSPQIAILQYTSGSTSLPKGVMVTHGNIIANELMVCVAFGHDHESHFVGWAPLFHDQGLIGNLFQPLYIGATCTLFSPMAFIKRPLLWLKAISRYGAHTSGGPNFAFELCAREVELHGGEGIDLSSWKVAFNGAEPVRPDTLERFARAMAPYGFDRRALYPCYGLAEGTLFATGFFKGSELVSERFSKQGLERGRAEVVATSGRQLISCGVAHAGGRALVVNPATLRPCAPDEVGEVWLSGPAIAKGYWNKPVESEATFGARLQDAPDEGTFLRTGDLGLFSPEKGLFVTGRIKDVIIVRGRNHYPQDIERTASRCHRWLINAPSVAFSLEGDQLEQLVWVTEVDREADETLEVEALSAQVARAIFEEHDLPLSALLLVRPGSIPRTTSGKVQRSLTKRMYLARELEPWAARSTRRGQAQLSSEVSE